MALTVQSNIKATARHGGDIAGTTGERSLKDRLAWSDRSVMITGPQLRAARELIGLSQLSLAVQFQLGLRSIIEFEAGEKSLSWQSGCQIKRALEAAGLEFATSGPGVRLR
jgi:hypothetical protein